MMERVTITIGIRTETASKLKKAMHPGQTYDGIITELLNTKSSIPQDILARLQEYQKPNHTINETIGELLDAVEKLQASNNHA